MELIGNAEFIVLPRLNDISLNQLPVNELFVSDVPVFSVESTKSVVPFIPVVSENVYELVPLPDDADDAL